MLNRHLTPLLFILLMLLPVTQVQAQSPEKSETSAKGSKASEKKNAGSKSSKIDKIKFAEDTSPEFRRAVEKMYSKGDALEKLRKKPKTKANIPAGFMNPLLPPRRGSLSQNLFIR